VVERKLATVVFVDLVDSTGLVAGADPEVVRQRVSGYFELVSGLISGHGGTVEKFAGDAVMAAFGVPLAHEDDVERALRAALEIVPAVAALGLGVRIGVDSGEVVVGEGDSTFATGEAVNLAARLQQAAGPGEILLGGGARRLAAATVEAESVGPLEIKGRPEPLWAWRLLRVRDPARLPGGAPFVGRDVELELLENSLRRATQGRVAHLVTVFGDPGVGKSRLVAEFVDSLERVTVLSGRALPYGEGVTYWPLASMIKASAGITDDDPANEAFDKLRRCCESEAVADLLAVALGVLGAAEGERNAQELTWAAQQWAEQLADTQPLVLLFEDVQWADEPLLDLIEQLIRSLRTVPVLVVAIARPELLDTRPSWGGGIRRASTVDLVPLDPTESAELADALLAGVEVGPAQRTLVLERAEGNPLFLEEIARTLREGEEVDGLPDTVQAMIAARIDRLDPDEKRILQSAALIGRVFWQGALGRLESDLAVGTLLERLVDRQFVLSEERSTISGDRAFRFAHVLIRDVAYGSMSKALRAEEHQTFAQWIAEQARDELVGIRAYHLDQAARLQVELSGALPSDLAEEAAAALEESGQGALQRGAFLNARRALVRAGELSPNPRRRYLAARAAWRLSDVPTVRTEAEEALAEACAAGLAGVEGQALVLLADLALHAESDVARAHDLADEALAILPPAELRGLYDAHALIARIFWWQGDAAGVSRHAEAMLDLAHEARRPELESLALTQLAGVASVQGDTARTLELLDRAEALAAESEGREALGQVLAARGRSCSGNGESADAERNLHEALEIFQETGAAGSRGWALSQLAWIYAERGDAAEAEETFREAVDVLHRTHEQGYLVEAERGLAEALVKQGKIDEAERIVAAVERRVGREDVWTRASILHATGLVRAAQGRTDEAFAAFSAALAIVEPTMYTILADEIHASLDALQAGVSAPAPSPG
jgi:class 3 adenylate cyclase/tetratricopeptide (TPR) repeat protein